MRWMTVFCAIRRIQKTRPTPESSRLVHNIDVGGNRVDFFISHAGRDRAWGEWVAWQLIQTGYAVELDVWDWAAGQNFIMKISDALDRADRVVALFSTAYFDSSRYTTEEWSASVLHMAGMAYGRLLPLRVEEMSADQIPAVLRPLLYRDLFGLEEVEARRVLLEAVAPPSRPDVKPSFPGRRSSPALSGLGGFEPRMPGSMPRVWNLPPRNPGFTGRDHHLLAIRDRLLAGDRAVVQALHGMGGIGKTQLAAEYAYRFAGDYDIVWWIAAEHSALIADQVAALGVDLNGVPSGADTSSAARAVLAQLRSLPRWLLVFDNATSAEDVAPWLPGSAVGHVLITSRQSGWDEIAAPVEIDVFARAESTALLRDRVLWLTAADDADLLAEALGDLPLGIVQAASYLRETGIPASEYRDLLDTRAAQVLGEGRPLSYPLSLAAATRLAVDRLAEEEPVVMELLTLCAFLAPEPIPVSLFSGKSHGPDTLSECADPVMFRRILAVIARSALARIGREELQMHRLIQAILRDHLSLEKKRATRRRAQHLLIVANPGDPGNPENWHRYGQLLPHILAADLVGLEEPSGRKLLIDSIRYMRERGDYHTSRRFADQAYRRWVADHGPDHPDTLAVATDLARSWWRLGDYSAARRLDEDTLERRRFNLGPDHPDTLRSAANLATDLRLLGQLEAARRLDEDTLERRRRIFGYDHPDTLNSAQNVAIDLRELGSAEAARQLDVDTLERRCKVLGVNHPNTLTSASNLAIDLRILGEVEAARQLNEDTLEQRRRILGDNHLNTLRSASNLARDLFELGELKAAKELDEGTLARRRRVLGEDHPDTVRSVNNLIEDLRAMNETQLADQLDSQTRALRQRVLGYFCSSEDPQRGGR